MSFQNLRRSDDHMEHGKNGIEIELKWPYRILKYIGRFIVRLKAIKYKEDFFYYLSFYLNLGL